jgi:threonine-phosphate decarboxylase
MLNHKDHFHGSDLEQIEAIYHIKKEEIISFSANINPLGISGNLRNSLSHQLDAITTYPDREYRELKKCIASYADTLPENIIVGNGSTELISLFIQTYAPKKALIIGPTYSEYEREISLEGGSTLYYPLHEEQDFRLDTEDLCAHLNDSLDLLVLCNPNNPTSTSISRREMRRILDACLQSGIFVMIDETYVEFTSEEDAVSSVPLTNYYTNLIILRGTSKFFAAPGLRLGYAITGNRDLIRSVNTRQNPWSISSLAEIAGRLMFQDREYIEKTRTLISGERDRLYRLLSGWAGVKAYRPTANFMLVKILKENADADMLFDHCIRKGLMIRNCSTFPFLNNRFIRFCFMNPEQNDLLLQAFREVLE